jgi:hypothetical protein
MDDELDAALQLLRSKRDDLAGAANKKARQKLNQKIRKLEEQQQQQEEQLTPPAAAAAAAAAPPGPNYLPESEPGCPGRGHVVFGPGWRGIA